VTWFDAVTPQKITAVMLLDNLIANLTNLCGEHEVGNTSLGITFV